MADFHECGVIERKQRLLFAESLRPFVCDFGEMRISAGSEVGDEFRQRMGEILVIADTEAMALHDDVAAEAVWFIVERNDGGAFFAREDGIGDGVAASGKRFVCYSPIDGIDSF